jgi:hypothetical protein
MPVSCQVDPQTGVDAANGLALMAICCVGAGYPGVISPGHRRVPVPLCRHRQIHQVAESDPYGENQQETSSQVHQVYRLPVRGPEQKHNRQWVTVH